MTTTIPTMIVTASRRNGMACWVVTRRRPNGRNSRVTFFTLQGILTAVWAFEGVVKLRVSARAKRYARVLGGA